MSNKKVDYKAQARASLRAPYRPSRRTECLIRHAECLHFVSRGRRLGPEGLSSPIAGQPEPGSRVGPERRTSTAWYAVKWRQHPPAGSGRGGERPGGEWRPGPATHMQNGGRMIVLQNKNIPLSLTFTKGKKGPFFQKR